MQWRADDIGDQSTHNSRGSAIRWRDRRRSRWQRGGNRPSCSRFRAAPLRSTRSATPAAYWAPWFRLVARCCWSHLRCCSYWNKHKRTLSLVLSLEKRQAEDIASHGRNVTQNSVRKCANNNNNNSIDVGNFMWVETIVPSEVYGISCL